MRAQGLKQNHRINTRPTRGTALWFALVSLGWTWCLGASAAAAEGPSASVLHLASLVGPLVAVGIVTARCGPSYRREIFRRSVDPRPVSVRWWAATVVVGVGPGLIAWLLVATEAGLRAETSITSLAGIAAFAVAAGLVEETGWRGIAQDGVVRTRDWLPAAILLGVLWSAWHLPLYFIEGTYQEGLGTWTAAFWLSMWGRVPLAVLLAWLVRGTHGAVVAAAVAHALGNLVGELLAGGIAAMAVESALLTAGAATVAAAVIRRR